MKKVKKKIFKIDNKVFFVKMNNMTKKEFLNIFKVKKNTYFYKLYERLFDYLISGCINLNDEYNHYYKNEYNCFELFLEEHYNIPRDLIPFFNNKISCYKNKTVGCELPLYNLIHNEEIRNVISEFMGGFVYEN